MLENGCAISVIVPVYNVENYLIRCVTSLTNQVFSDIEIILVDDGSTDDSSKLCDMLAENDQRIRVLHKKNGGLADARNAGLDVAKGKYIGFVDSDDYIDRDMYRILYESISNYPECAIASGVDESIFPGDKHIRASVLPEVQVLSNEELIRRFLFQDGQPSVGVCNKLFRRFLFDDIRFPKGMINEDAITLIKLYKKTSELVLNGKALYYYCHREGSITKSAFNKHIHDFIEMNKMVEIELQDVSYPFIKLGCKLRLLYAYRDILVNMVSYDFNKDEYHLVKSKYNALFLGLLFRQMIPIKARIKLLLLFISPTLYNSLRRTK